MIETHLNLFDAAVIAVLALSCLFAFFRGFVREVLSLGAWIGAAIITVYYFPDMAQRLKPHFKNPVAAAGIGTLIIYTLALIGFSIINSIILKYVKTGKEIGMLDNFMGFVFGLARGGLIVSLGYFMLTLTMPEKEYPKWLKQSVTRPYAELGAIKLAKVAPEYLREISSLEKKAEPDLQAIRKVEDESADDDTEKKELSEKKKNTDDADESASPLDRFLNSLSPSR